MAPSEKLLDLIALVDNVPLDFHDNCSPYYRLFLDPDPRPHGYVHPDTISRMPWPPWFIISHTDKTITLSGDSHPSIPPATHAEVVLQQAIDQAIPKDIFPILHREHSELVRIPGAAFPVRLERFAGPLFGICLQGAHLTGYVRSPAGLQIWVARRSRTLFTYPGQLDSTVAGGVKASDTPLSCILAESQEEACLDPAYVAAHVVATGVITAANINVRSELFHAEAVHVFDLEMPADMVPKPGDNEVEEFVLMGVEEVRTRMLAGEFKPNVCSVMIDFLIRHGVVTADSEEDYVEICGRLRRRVPMPTSAGMKW